MLKTPVLGSVENTRFSLNSSVCINIILPAFFISAFIIFLCCFLHKITPQMSTGTDNSQLCALSSWYCIPCDITSYVSGVSWRVTRGVSQLASDVLHVVWCVTCGISHLVSDVLRHDVSVVCYGWCVTYGVACHSE